MKTTKEMQPKSDKIAGLADRIDQAADYDRRGDTALRDQAVRQILGDECGLPTAYIRSALRRAGLIR